MSAEFPRVELVDICRAWSPGSRHRLTIERAIKAYDELALRCVEDNTKHSLTIAGLRARIRELEGK